LLEAQGNLTAAFLTRIGDDGEVRGVEFQPRGLGGGSGETDAKNYADCNQKARASAVETHHTFTE
jgi:hypothetical protein